MPPPIIAPPITHMTVMNCSHGNSHSGSATWFPTTFPGWVTVMFPSCSVTRPDVAFHTYFFPSTSITSTWVKLKVCCELSFHQNEDGSCATSYGLESIQTTTPVALELMPVWPKVTSHYVVYLPTTAVA